MFILKIIVQVVNFGHLNLCLLVISMLSFFKINILKKKSSVSNSLHPDQA